DPVDVPIAALDQHVRQQCGDDFARRRFVEDHHVINATELGHHFGAFVLIENWAFLAFQFASRTVAVERDYQSVSEPPRRLKISYVPRVNQVEASVGENNTTSQAPQTLTFRL